MIDRGRGLSLRRGVNRGIGCGLWSREDDGSSSGGVRPAGVEGRVLREADGAPSRCSSLNDYPRAYVDFQGLSLARLIIGSCWKERNKTKI